MDDTLTSEESREIEKLLLAEWGDKWGTPLTTAELLEIGRDGLESLFHKPPIGPIPEYLRPYSSVHGCVAEYEEKLQELERWKARELGFWLENRVGKKILVGEQIYQLHEEKGKDTDSAKYWFRLIETKLSNE